jgi:hypothetical protein
MLSNILAVLIPAIIGLAAVFITAAKQASTQDARRWRSHF